MANEAYQKVVSMIDRTVNDAGILLRHLQDRPQRSSSASNYSSYGVRGTARAKTNDSCKTPPSPSASTSGSAHTPPYSRKRKTKIVKEQVYTNDPQYDNHGEVRIMHANNVYITWDSDGMVVGMPEPIEKTEECKANGQAMKVNSLTKTAVEGERNEKPASKVDKELRYDASKMITKERKRTPKITTPRTKSSSKSTSKKKKSYLKETVTRTEIFTRKEVPDGVSPSKAVIKNKEIKTTTTTNIYPDKTPEAPLPETQVKRTFTRSESSVGSKNAEPFSRFLLNGEKESCQKDNVATVKDALEAALTDWEEKHRPKKPIDPYRPPKKTSKKSFRTSSKKSSRVKVIKIDTSTANTSESAKVLRRKASKKKKREKTNVAKSKTPTENDDMKTATGTTSNGGSTTLPEWGLASAELPVEKRAKREKLEPPSTLTFSPSHSSLLGKKVKPRSPPKVRRHSRNQKRSEGFNLAERSESYLDRQISAARRRERTAKKQIRQARDSIKESRKSMKDSDKERRSVKIFENPTSPRFLKPKYDVPDELKIQREESSTSDSSKKIEKARTPRKKESKREPSDISEATFMKTAKIATPTQPVPMPEWGLSSQELAVEYSSPKRVTTAKPPTETLRYSSSHSSLIGGKVQRKSPPSARFRKHSKKSRRSDGLQLAEKSESYLDRQISAARKREKTAKLQIQRSRTKIIEARKAMKEIDEASRSKKTFENPVSPKYLKARYAVPEELKVHRDSDEKVSDQSDSERRPKSPTSDSKSDKRSSKPSKKEDRKKYVETEEFLPEKPERSESYLNLVSRYAIAGRKIKKPLEKTENIRAKRASIRQSRKTMSGHDKEKRSREFMNPAKAPSVHTIQKKQEVIASELQRVEEKQALSPKEFKSRTRAYSPKIGRHFKRLEAPGARRSRKRHMKRRPKKKEKFRLAGPSQSWLQHSLKFAEAGRKARRKPGDEDHLPEGFKKSGKVEGKEAYSGEEVVGSKEKTASDRDKLDTALSMDLSGSERDSIRAKRDFPSLRENTAGRPRSESLKLIYNTARSKTPTKRRDEGPVCWRCKKCNATLTPSMVSRGEAEMESPLALTSAGPTEESTVDPRLLTPRGSATSLRKSSKSRREKSEVKKSTLAEPIPPCTCEDKIAIRDSAPENDLNFDAKFELHDVDTDRQHTLVINGYFIDKNLKRLTLNGMFCKL
ncbi:unnamed protein product [Cylicocyclus nassatus]|uniref:Uncharacterized protein n=1 Tax=Cylicocyclus nassatus TaxID=53992 RepID=A0AA36M1W9_CYLNA|nr:unnamed protein product [Cylicocyclus nassatus]